MSHKNAKWFGSFKNKFHHSDISRFVYSLSALERFLTPFLIVSVGPTFLSALIPCALFFLELLFICVKKPYIEKVGICGPILKKATSIIICILFACSSFVSVESSVNMVLSICILVLLLVIVVYSCIVAGKEIYQNYKRLREDKIDEIQKYEDEILLTV